MNRVASVVAEDEYVRVTFDCGHSCLWEPLPGYTTALYLEKLKFTVGTAMDCPVCLAEEPQKRLSPPGL